MPNRLRSRNELLNLYKDCFIFDERQYNEAMSGDDIAFCNIGMDFAQSLEYDLAVECWKNIESKKIPEVYNNLGVSYFYGNGVELNYETALSYYRKSEELGNDYGIYNVGVCYERGVGGVKKDLTIALEKYRIAAKMGNQMAVENIQRITGEYVTDINEYSIENVNHPKGIYGNNSCDIERGTNYAYKLNKAECSFNSIYNLAKDFISELSQEEKNDLFDRLSHGVDILNSEPVLNMYIYSYGQMHAAKLKFAYEHLPKEFLQEKEISLIDYGCGQGLGIICYHDFLKKIDSKQQIKKIILVEPSEFCLKRAGLHAQKFFPDAELHCICNTFNNINSSDLSIASETPSLNIFSNVLDMDCFDLKELANTIKDSQSYKKQFVCVSPYINKATSAKLDEFANAIGAKDIYKYISNDGEFCPGKKWTCDLRIFTQVSYEQLYNNLIAKAHEEESRCRSEIGTIMGEIFLKETEKSYLEAIKVYSNPEAYYNLGNLFKDFEKYDKAISYYKKSISMTEDNEVYCNMGVCYYNQENDEMALKCFEKAIKICSEDYVSYFNMGNALTNLGRKDEAQKCYAISESLKIEAEDGFDDDFLS